MQPAGVRPRLLDLGNGGSALIDEADAKRVDGYGWYQTANGYVGAMTTDKRGKRKLLLLHRLLTGEPSGCHVDHINGDKLDNRRENLRAASYQRNQVNRKRPNRNNRSGVRGVHWRADMQKWIAQITADRQNHYLGSFAVLEDAKTARRDAELHYFGEVCP